VARVGVGPATARRLWIADYRHTNVVARPSARAKTRYGTDNGVRNAAITTKWLFMLPGRVLS